MKERRGGSERGREGKERREGYERGSEVKERRGGYIKRERDGRKR